MSSSPKTPLTPQQKEHDKRRKVLNGLCNSIKSHFAFKTIKTWRDVEKFTTVPSGTNLDEVVTKETLKSFLDGLLSNLENILLAELGRSAEGNPVQKASSPAPTPTQTTRQPELQMTTPAVVTTPTPIAEAPVVIDLNADNDYGFVSSPNERYSAFWFQKKAITEAMETFAKQQRAKCIISPTGSGKTFICGAILRRLVDTKHHVGKCFGSTKYLYVTRATIVEQTKRVFRETFNLGIKDGVEVLNIEQLRSRAGSMWVEELSKIEGGQEVFYWQWRFGVTPCVVIWDECQALKNQGSTQHNIAVALNEMDGVTQFFVSATPFTRVAEAKCFAVATRKDVTSLFGVPTRISNANWPTYAAHVAQGDPMEYNEAAVERLMKDLDDYTIRVKGIRPQFDAINKVQMIDFQTKEEHEYYKKAWDRYLEEKSKLDAEAMKNGEGVSGISILVEFLKFRMAAEYCRKDYLAKRMYESVTQGNKAAVCALNFKGTIIQIVKILVEQYGVPRSKISLVWGGGQTQLTKKQKAKQTILEQAEELKKIGMDTSKILENLDLDDVEDRQLEELDPALRLGAQTPEERQREIDRFQSGKSDYCLFTFRAGGVGLSLHHTDEQSPVKVRKQKNGYAYTEDIPNVPIKPRVLFAAPTYSAIEIVQGLGRCPRLTSLSNTEQFLIFYRGTIEEDVADIVSRKLRCLSKVVRNKERWQDIVTTGAPKSSHLQDIPDDDVNDGDALEGQSPSDED